MKIYNSLTKQIEEFKNQAVEPKTVIIYTCGLTPYDAAHIGHARTFVAFDIIKRYLVKIGYAVYHVQNITDVDDKIIKRCRETAADPKVLTETIHSEALALFDRLNIIKANVYPKVTAHMGEIISIIEKLVSSGFAYETDSGVYYSVNKFKEYGKLSGQKIDEVKAGARVEVDETKKAAEDFALWKKTKGEIIEFDSPWGSGRPGWHIECSALAEKYGNGTLDIHGGGRDLIFPHHENEIAQSEAAFGHKLANLWMHTGPLTVDGEKMSKSLGNFVTLNEVVSKFDPNAIRMFFTQTHYRSSADYNEDAINAAYESVERIFNTMGLIEESLGMRDKKDDKFRKATNDSIVSFYSAMEKDFDTPNALAALFNIVKSVNSHLSETHIDKEQLIRIKEELAAIVWIFGFKERTADIASKLKGLKSIAKDISLKYGFQLQDSEDPEAIMNSILGAREEFRKKKNYQASDEIRSKLAEAGIVLEDSSKGSKKKIR